MNIALDATPLSIVTGGIARYTAELAVALAAEFPDDSFFLLSDQPFRHPSPVLPNLQFPQISAGLMTRRWWSAGLPRTLSRLRVNLFHGTDFAVPYRWSPPSVMTLHDLSPWIQGAWHRSSRIVRRTPWMLRLGFARTVITPTEAIRKQVIDHFGLSPSRVVAVPLAASAVFKPAPKRDEPPYFLVVGTIEPRKNIPAVVESWRALQSESHVHLKIIGRTRPDSPTCTNEQRLEYLGIVDDEELVHLYSNALAVLMPSLYEGFGLPVLEAMQCGAPVAVSADPALREVSGGAALPVDRDWTAALRALVDDPQLRARLSAQSLARAREFSWGSTARRTHDVYRETLRGLNA